MDRLMIAAGGPVTIAGEQRSRDALADEAARQQARLAGTGRVAVVAYPTITAVTTMLAVLTGGQTLVPVSPDAGPRERDHVLADSGARLLVDGSAVRDLPVNAGQPAADAALILYTSGTTGSPKGVPIRADAVVGCIAGLADAWGWTAEDTLVHGLPLNHVHGLVLGLLGPLIVGSAVTHTGRPTPQAYAHARGTMYFGVPTVWSRVAADPSSARALSGARLLVSGSAALPGPVFDTVRGLTGLSPVERYGMTETLITFAARSDEPVVRGSVGRPLPDTSVRLRPLPDADGPLEDRDVGLLEVRGPSVFDGYLGRPEATAQAMTADGWFVTGDVARRADDGTYRVLGRAKSDFIKSGGYRVGAGEVEDALLVHPDVQEVAVVGVPDEDLGERIVAFVVGTPGAQVDASALAEHVAATLSRHKRPRQVVLVDSLPRNAMGKVDKAVLQNR